MTTQEIIVAWTGVLAVAKERSGKIYFRSFIRRIRMSILWV